MESRGEEGALELAGAGGLAFLQLPTSPCLSRSLTFPSF